MKNMIRLGSGSVIVAAMVRASASSWRQCSASRSSSADMARKDPPAQRQTIFLGLLFPAPEPKRCKRTPSYQHSRHALNRFPILGISHVSGFVTLTTQAGVGRRGPALLANQIGSVGVLLYFSAGDSAALLLPTNECAGPKHRPRFAARAVEVRASGKT